MSDTVVGALIGIMAALAGSIAAFILEWIRRSKEREAEAIAALQRERASAYRLYISKAHLAMHALGAVSEPKAKASQADRLAAMALVHREARAALYELEVVADEETVKAAWALHEIIRSFRDDLVGQGIKSDAPAWKDARPAYWEARKAFLTLARRDILASGAE